MTSTEKKQLQITACKVRMTACFHLHNTIILLNII